MGRVNSVTGAGFGNVSTYASALQYRAGGQLSHLTFGNLTQPLSATYNARLQPISFTALSINMSYQYYDDGRVKFSHDQFDQRFDRSYSYDQAGRMTRALSGAEARGEAPTNNRPYKEDSAFDVFGNVTSRTGKHWSRSLPAFGGTYDNNRRDGWQYDADGRNLVSNSVTSTFDAAGRLVQTSGPQRRNNPPLVPTLGFDGDGRQIKKTQYGQDYYLLRSTALAGALVTEIFGADPGQLPFGQTQRGHVYVNGTELAHQSPISGDVSYVPVDPSGVVNLSVTSGQLDPLGNDVGDEDPYLPETDPGFSYPHMGDISDPGGGCVSNGVPMNCSRGTGRSRLRRVINPPPGSRVAVRSESKERKQKT